MNKQLNKLLAVPLLLLISLQANAWQGYSSVKEIGQRVQSAAKSNPNLIKVKSIAKSVDGNDVWAVTLGGSQSDNKPAVAIIAGIDSRHLVGVETAVSFVEQMAKNPSANEILKEHTFYVFPCANPDALKGYFGAVKQEITRTSRPYDNDRDGLMSEDPAEDLDGSGTITAMILKSAKGEYIKHPDYPQVMVLADKSKGEKGIYELFTEGVDNDKDGLLNEDGKDGVNLNRNFTYKFKNWKSESGDIPVSEVETRSILDFMYAQFNIHSLFILGENDNIANPTKYIARHRKGAAVKPSANPPAVANPYDVTAFASLESDNNLANRVSNIFKDNNPAANNFMAAEPLDGNMMEWAYYHYGRNAFATTVWSVDKKDSRNSAEAAYIAWAAKNSIENSYSEWKSIEHPDFKGESVEVGSLTPYAMFTPPLNLIKKDIEATHKTILDVAELSPKIELDKVEVESVKGNIYRITARILNSGEMATATNTGKSSYFVKYVRAELKLDNQKILSGVRLVTIPTLDGGATATVSWLVQGSGNITLETGCPQGGFVSKSLTLKGNSNN